MKYCAIDIDDVLGSFSAVLNPALNKTFKRDIPVESWLNFNMTPLYDINSEQFFDVIISQGLLSQMLPYADTRQALQRLKDAGYAIVLITSRGYHPQALELTKAWLAEHRLPYLDLIIKPEGITKAEASRLAYPKGFEFMVDDFPANLDHMGQAGMAKHLVLIDQPWNRDRIDYKNGNNRFSSLGQYVETLLGLEMSVQFA